MSKTRIALADDHPIVLAGLTMLINAQPDFEIVGTASSGPEAIQVLSQVEADLAIIDISLPGLNGLQVTKHLTETSSSPSVIILTQSENSQSVHQALAAGARGFVLKKSAASCLVDAIRGVIVGGIYIDPIIAGTVFQQSRNKRSPERVTTNLTDRESEVLRSVAFGMTTKQIASRLRLSTSSIETYKVRANQKIGASSRADVVRYASAEGWLTNMPVD